MLIHRGGGGGGAGGRGVIRRTSPPDHTPPQNQTGDHRTRRDGDRVLVWGQAFRLPIPLHFVPRK